MTRNQYLQRYETIIFPVGNVCDSGTSYCSVLIIEFKRITKIKSSMNKPKSQFVNLKLIGLVFQPANI